MRRAALVAGPEVWTPRRACHCLPGAGATRWAGQMRGLGPGAALRDGAPHLALHLPLPASGAAWLQLCVRRGQPSATLRPGLGRTASAPQLVTRARLTLRLRPRWPPQPAGAGELRDGRSVGRVSLVQAEGGRRLGRRSLTGQPVARRCSLQQFARRSSHGVPGLRLARGVGLDAGTRRGGRLGTVALSLSLVLPPQGSSRRQPRTTACGLGMAGTNAQDPQAHRAPLPQQASLLLMPGDQLWPSSSDLPLRADPALGRSVLGHRHSGPGGP